MHSQLKQGLTLLSLLVLGGILLAGALLGGYLLLSSGDSADANDRQSDTTAQFTITHTDTVRNIAWRGDGGALLSWDSDTVLLHDPHSGAQIATLSDGQPVINALWSGDQQSRIILWSDPTFIIYNGQTGAEISRFTPQSPVRVYDVNHDGSRLYAATDAALQVWDTTQGTLLWENANERFVDWNADGSRLVTQTDPLSLQGTQTTLTVWGIPGGNVIASISAESVAVNISPDGQAMLQWDSALLYLWDLRIPGQPQRLMGNFNTLMGGHMNTDSAWAPDSQSFAILFEADTFFVGVFDTAGNQRRASPFQPSAGGTGPGPLEWLNTEYVWVGGGRGGIMVYDAATGTQKLDVCRGFAIGHRWHFTETGLELGCLVSSGAQAHLEVWDVENGTQRSGLPAEIVTDPASNSATMRAPSADLRYVDVLYYAENDLEIWDVATQTRLYKYDAPADQQSPNPPQWSPATPHYAFMTGNTVQVINAAGEHLSP